jgi:hypothetical protein
MFLDQPLNLPNLGRYEASAALQADWHEPELGGVFIPLDMNVGAAHLRR